MTLTQWQARLDAYLAAETAILANQEYEIESGNGRRRLKRADLAAVQAEITRCNREIARASRTRSATRFLVPE